MGDAEKSARTFPTIDGVRWSVPGDRANVLADGRIELLGRDSVTVNSGGEKIFVEEVERAIAAHPNVYDVVVVGRPSERWGGQEVVAVVQLADGASASDEELAEICGRSVARYKIPQGVHPRTEDRALAGRQGGLPLGRDDSRRCGRVEPPLDRRQVRRDHQQRPVFPVGIPPRGYPSAWKCRRIPASIDT